MEFARLIFAWKVWLLNLILFYQHPDPNARCFPRRFPADLLTLTKERRFQHGSSPNRPPRLGQSYAGHGLPSREGVQGRRAYRQGHRYRTLLVDNGYMELNVLVADGDALDMSDGQAIPVRFDNLTVRPYVDKNKSLAYSAAADGVHAVNTNKA